MAVRDFLRPRGGLFGRRPQLLGKANVADKVVEADAAGGGAGRLTVELESDDFVTQVEPRAACVHRRPTELEGDAAGGPGASGHLGCEAECRRSHSFASDGRSRGPPQPLVGDISVPLPLSPRKERHPLFSPSRARPPLPEPPGTPGVPHPPGNALAAVGGDDGCLPPPSYPDLAPVPQVSFVLVGDALELLMAPGDVLVVRTGPEAPLSSRLISGIGTTHGLMGHVLLVLSAPMCVPRRSEEGEMLQAAFPTGAPEVEELWKVRTLESTRAEEGLHEVDTLLYVERGSGRLVLVGELELGQSLCLSGEAEQLELWQSPAELRARLRLDLMQGVLRDMKAKEASWSGRTALRAVLSSASLGRPADGTPVGKFLDDVRACWEMDPICTSIVVGFWQRYLCMLASASTPPGSRPASVRTLQSSSPSSLVPSEGSATPAVGVAWEERAMEMILRWMPVKADRGLPGDLVAAFRSSGWIPIGQVPRIFRPLVLPPMPAATAGPRGSCPATACKSCPPQLGSGELPPAHAVHEFSEVIFA